MRTVRDDLKDDEIKMILQALESDQFTNIEKTDDSINFRQGFRTFSIMSTDVNAEDMGIRVDFDKEILFQDEDKNQSKKLENYKKVKEKMSGLYSEKTRHSTSFSNKTEAFIDEDQAINSIEGWKLVEAYPIAVDDAWNADLHALVVYHVQIHGKDHVIIDGKVCQGTPDKFLSLGQFNILEQFHDKNFIQVLKKLNQVESY